MSFVNRRGAIQSARGGGAMGQLRASKITDVGLPHPPGRSELRPYETDFWRSCQQASQ